MKYCKECLYPDTKPDLQFNEEGVCAACLAFKARKETDWLARDQEFRNLVRKVMAVNHNRPYDCIVPVSGGKDSTYQIIKCIEMGLRPLAVTAMTCELSGLGWQNLHNITKLGVDHVMVQVDRELRGRINKYCLQTVGDISWPEHVLIFTVPIREAINRGISLIVYGENPQNEYGGPDLDSVKAETMNERWLQEFGGLCGLRVADLIDAGIMPPHKAAMYSYPSKELFEVAGLKAVFLGQFFPWDGKLNADHAMSRGFRPHHSIVEGSFGNYENLDNYQTGIHDYFMYLKYGFGRATSILNTYIRRGRLTRDAAISIAAHNDGLVPHTYLGQPLKWVLENINMTVGEFAQAAQKFANPKLFDLKHSMPKAKFVVGEDFVENASNSLPTTG